MAGAVSIQGSEGEFDPVLVTVPITRVHSHARLSLLGFFGIDTVPFPPKTLCPHPLSWGPSSLFTI